MFPPNDDRYLEHVVDHTYEDDQGYEIHMEPDAHSKAVGLTSGPMFYLQKPVPVVPEKGMTVRTYGLMGEAIRGVFLNGVKVYYRTVAEDKAAHAKWVAEDNIRKQEAFEQVREDHDRRIAALPEVFQKRFKKFWDNNPDFRWKFESYELMVCEQAWLLVCCLGTEENLHKWWELKDYAEQLKQVPGLDPGHSNNSIGITVRLAHHYLTNPDNVVAEHGALVYLVGCKEYGCPHPDDPEPEEEKVGYVER
jgi:hypothetical protein